MESLRYDFPPSAEFLNTGCRSFFSVSRPVRKCFTQISHVTGSVFRHEHLVQRWPIFCSVSQRVFDSANLPHKVLDFLLGCCQFILVQSISRLSIFPSAAQLYFSVGFFVLQFLAGGSQYHSQVTKSKDLVFLVLVVLL
jgi:hypothetical protein